ncbi:MAG: YihY/virulence factor BrkB family protein [Desulfobulbaceae bacterium]|jgi:membrane protein|nr:YihY/virulence factor BrkB family protein [Desulfobulbaceae bacterium]
MSDLREKNRAAATGSPAAEDLDTRQGWTGSLQRWSFKTREAERGLAAMVRSLLRVAFIVTHEFSETGISLRASALTYSIVLSMVPLLALSTALLKGMGGGDQLKTAAYRFIDQLEPQYPGGAPPVDPAASPGDTLPGGPPAAGDIPPEPESLTRHLRNAVDTIFDYVERTNFAAIGAFGIIGLLWAVILLMSTIEAAMNAIWHSRRGRPMFRKIMDYLALLILLPVSINIAIAGDAVLASPEIMARLRIFIPSAWAVTMLLKLLPFLFVILTLMVMYMFFPAERVKTSAAFIGALFGGICWFVVQKGYILLQIGVSKYNAIYGSFASLPLFLIWVHLGWIFILLGAVLAYAIQNRNLYYLPGSRVSPQRTLQLALDILNTVYVNFSRKTPTTFDDLLRANPGEQPGGIMDIINDLIRGGLLHRTDDGGSAYVPAAPAETIEARQVVQLVLGHEKIPTTGGRFADRILAAAESAIPPADFPLITPASAAGQETAPDKENNEKTL